MYYYISTIDSNVYSGNVPATAHEMVEITEEMFERYIELSPNVVVTFDETGTRVVGIEAGDLNGND
ncbi:hypothetical protein FACS1894208_01150 [Clostridia bacterium]|nr:hypothetical protein FACS1894208_01150 [Clostridia bacterium]